MLNPSRALPRRLVIVATGLALVAASLTAVSSPAVADGPTTLTVVGTSDVSDSNLVQSVIKPLFEAAHPAYSLNYVAKGTGAAITYAEAGTADALIVHAPSLENQFVSQGYSLEPFGRAIFWGDYILAGATSDPAGVKTNGTQDIVQAYEDIAAKGATIDPATGDPEANFVSRGGSPPPGTVVQEHAIWALTTGVPTCIVSDANGGGAVPSTTNIGQACPTTATPPAWYHSTGLTQGPNITNANTCNYPGATTNNCYVFTDRGTYAYLESGGSTASPTMPPTNLSILTRNNSTTATGGNTLLVNTFHAYAVNPQKVGTSLNTVGATDLLNFLTSPAGQTAIGNYLNGTKDPPFIPDAAPKVTLSTPPSTVTAPGALAVTGSLDNVVPGTPALSGVTVQLLGTPTTTPDATPTQVGSAVTDSAGAFKINYPPSVNMTYSVFTPDIPSKIEYPDLNPQFSDQLQSTTTSLGEIDVQGAVHGITATGAKNHLTVKGTTNPKHHGSGSYATLYARPAGSSQTFAYHGRQKLKAGYDTFHARYYLKNGKWSYYIRYANPGYILTGQSATKTVTVN